MRIVDADCTFKDEGFDRAVKIYKPNIENVKAVQAIVDYARNKGKGKPIVDEDGKERILIQIKEDSQYSYPIQPIGDLKKFLETFFE